MGYRHYFYQIPKQTIEEVKNLTYEELITYLEKEYPKAIEVFEDDKWVDLDRIGNAKEIFEFGKLYYDDTADQIYSAGTPMFQVEETQSHFEDYDPYVVGKEGLLKAIEIYRGKIINFYKQLLADNETTLIPILGLERTEEKSKEDKQEDHVKQMLREWEAGFTINLDESKPQLTNSWLYEYTIFELIRLLKSIDWEKDTIMFFGR